MNRGVAPDDAVAAFRDANQLASRHINRNAVLNGLLRNQSDERLAGSLMLAQLRNELRPHEFEQLAGTMLGELGRNRAGDFSLRQFVSDWGRVQDAGRIMFSAQHLQNINDILGMGRHIDRALARANTSHTATTYWMVEAVMGAGSIAADVLSGHGALGPGLIIDAGQFATTFGLAWILASPARAASAARWVNARRALDLGVTAARMAAFVTATRNLAHTLGVRVEDLAGIITQRDPLAGSAGPPGLPHRTSGRIPATQ